MPAQLCVRIMQCCFASVPAGSDRMQKTFLNEPHSQIRIENLNHCLGISYPAFQTWQGEGIEDCSLWMQKQGLWEWQRVCLSWCLHCPLYEPKQDPAAQRLYISSIFWISPASALWDSTCFQTGLHMMCHMTLEFGRTQENDWGK